MNLIMYCIMMLSTLSVAILQLGGSFLIGLIVFYLSSGFFRRILYDLFSGAVRRYPLPRASGQEWGVLSTMRALPWSQTCLSP